MFKSSYRKIFLCLGLLSFRGFISAKVCSPKVAIIGTGIGGASASHFLTQMFNSSLHIDAYEHNKVGGRLATIKVGQGEYEAGGAIIHPRNRYMQYFLKLLNLKRRKSAEDNDEKYGIWNGKEFVFETDYELIMLAKLIYRYGFQAFYLHRHVNSILDDFEKIYDVQDQQIAFDNVTELLSAMNKNFPTMLTESIKDYLLKLGIGEKLIDELVKATLVVNYGQSTDVQSFVGSVSIAGAGSDLWSVENGNKEIPKNLLLNNTNVNIIQSQVMKIQKHVSKEDSNTNYEVFYMKSNDTFQSKFYDIVIIATPMTDDQETVINFEGFNGNDNFNFLGNYQTTIATFVAGELNPHYFGLKKNVDVLSCDPDATIINSVGKISSVSGGETYKNSVWKIFSRQLLNESLLQNMFSEIEEVKVKVWKAYPKYSVTQRLDKFKLERHLYYVNAIEWAASAMEMSAIGGRNVAILAYNDYTKSCSLESKIQSSEKLQKKVGSDSFEL